jgi:hypothetical protein
MTRFCSLLGKFKIIHKTGNFSSRCASYHNVMAKSIGRRDEKRDWE